MVGFTTKLCFKAVRDNKLVLKKKNVKRGGSNFVQIFFLLFTPIFSPIWRDCILKGEERKFVGPTTFLSPSPSQPNTFSTHFLFYLSLFFFSILPQIHPTKHTLILCLDVGRGRGSRVEEGRVIKLPYLDIFKE